MVSIAFVACDLGHQNQIVATSLRAVDGNPMEEYLYRRQVTAHFYTWHRFAAAWSGSLPVIGPIFSAVEQDSVENLGSGSGRLAAAVQLHSHAGGAQAGYRPR